jgi:hypothetical protein
MSIFCSVVHCRRFDFGSGERHTHEALSAAMKIVVNSAYGYLGAAEASSCAPWRRGTSARLGRSPRRGSTLAR